MVFPEPGSMRTVKEIGEFGNKAMCADSRFAVAGTTCCDVLGSPINVCIFKGERTTFNTTRDRCAAYGTGYSTCAWSSVPTNWNCGTDVNDGVDGWTRNTSAGLRFSWMSTTCSMKVQIDPDGKVAMVHSGEFGRVECVCYDRLVLRRPPVLFLRRSFFSSSLLSWYQRC